MNLNRKSPFRTVLQPVLLALATLSGGYSPVSAQPLDGVPSISSDRPGQATPPSILLPGSIQIETGVQLTSDAVSADQMESTIRTVSVPAAVVRIGMLATMEFRLSAEYRSVITMTPPGTFETTVSGMSGIGLGTKIGVTPEQGAIPETAFLVTLALPLGEETFRVQNVAPTFLFAMRNGLSSSSNLYYNLGATWDGTNGRGYGLYNVLLASSLTSSLGVFAEVYGTLASGIPPTHAADLGFAYLLGNNLQVDLYGGAGITDNAPDYFIAGGISVRLPR